MTQTQAPAGGQFDAGRSHFITAPDGLQLHAREYGSRQFETLPVVCLPGLSRTAEDFAGLASALAQDGRSPRRVIALDYRGRGRSDYDPDYRNYSLAVELRDVDAVLTALAVGPAIFIGTSRGGLVTMLAAALHPARIAAAILNDIGPVLEPKGLMRIKGYLGRLPQPRSFAEGAEILRRLFDAQFPRFAREDWVAAAHLTWRRRNGEARYATPTPAPMPEPPLRPAQTEIPIAEDDAPADLVLNYDPKLARALEDIDFEHPLPTLWEQFDMLAGVPLMVIRGGLSDLLSAATVRQMRARRRKIEFVEIPDEGHPPQLGTPDMIRRIASFARQCDRAAAARR